MDLDPPNARMKYSRFVGQMRQSVVLTARRAVEYLTPHTGAMVDGRWLMVDEATERGPALTIIH
jgi:hypothetical protein